MNQGEGMILLFPRTELFHLGGKSAASDYVG